VTLRAYYKHTNQRSSVDYSTLSSTRSSRHLQLLQTLYPHTLVDLSDKEILEICQHAGNSGKFERLWRGDIGGYNSNSEADLGFCCMVAFYTRDRNQIQRLWLHSGLFREKMNRADYVNATITAALEQVRSGYKPPRRHRIVTSRFPGSRIRRIKL
jgi:primase-polymerase (primpol)-like protein